MGETPLSSPTPHPLKLAPVAFLTFCKPSTTPSKSLSRLKRAPAPRSVKGPPPTLPPPPPPPPPPRSLRQDRKSKRRTQVISFCCMVVRVRSVHVGEGQGSLEFFCAPP